MLELNRRGFIQSLGGGLAVLLTLNDEVLAQESGGGRRRGAEDLPTDVAAWLHIAPDGAITAFTGKVEVGQNIRTSLTQAVADELRCAPSAVRLVMGDTDLTPWDMGTFGSRTTPTMAPELRKMAATARETLIDAAAQQWNLPRASLRAANACVSDSKSAKKAGYGELAGKIQWVNVVGNAELITSPANWSVAGANLPKINAREIVSGQHKYVSDHKLPGMLYGRVLRPPSFGAKLKSVDTSAASKLPGVTVVRDGDFVGVAAVDERTAERAVASIEAQWDEQRSADARASAAVITSLPLRPGDTQVTSNYRVAYIAHVPLEPRAAVAQWTGNKLQVWAGTQRPFGVRSELASAFGLTEKDVRVLMPDTGSGYGGKHSGECAIEAARLAKAAGKPVKLIWTREEEFTWAYFRPAGQIRIDSSINAGGRIQSWNYLNLYSGPSGLPTPYEIANKETKKEQFIEGDSPLREGSYRGLAATANHFARECHMDEMAAKIPMDPLAFRLLNLKNERLRTVLQTACDRFGWGQHKPTAERGFGLACGFEKGGYIACCTEVSIGASRRLKVERVVAAWDCGAIVNPEHLKNQVEGAIVMGLGGALFEEIEHANGRISNPRLSQYRVPRFSDVPKIDVILIDHRDIPSAGAGETPMVAIAPSIGNAIFSATGLRVRSMPMLPAFAKA